MKSLGLLFCAVVLIAVGLSAPLPSPASAADLDCADFSSQAEAQENLLPGDPYGLDGDSDGIACEDNPCPCSSATGGGDVNSPSTPVPPPPPPPYHLSKSAARAESKRIAKKFVRRNAQVGSLSFGGCHRLATRRVDCDLTARGSTARQRTTCSLSVIVRAKDRHPVGRLASTDCRTKSLLLLSFERAKQSMLEAANPIAGKRVSIELTRINRLEFEGEALWGRPGAAPASSESCSLELFAELLPSDVVRVLVGEPACAGTPASRH
jgi:hypothetical protein